MSYKHNIIKERFDLQINSEGERVKKTFELDKHSDIVLGVQITSDREDLLFYRGTQKVQINDKELFPEEFESKLLMTGLNVAPDKRMITIGEIQAGNGRIEIYFEDKSHPETEFIPYRVSYYFFSKSTE